MKLRIRRFSTSLNTTWPNAKRLISPFGNRISSPIEKKTGEKNLTVNHWKLTSIQQWVIYYHSTYRIRLWYAGKRMCLYRPLHHGTCIKWHHIMKYIHLFSYIRNSGLKRNWMWFRSPCLAIRSASITGMPLSLKLYNNKGNQQNYYFNWIETTKMQKFHRFFPHTGGKPNLKW